MIEIEKQQLKKFSGNHVRSLLRLKVPLSQLFHENTKLTPLSSRKYGAWIAEVGQSRFLTSLMTKAYKLYSLMDQVALDPATPGTALEAVIAARRSMRIYSGEALSQDELGRLLFFSYGRTDGRHYYRAVPSGGALYPLEIYAVALRVQGLEAGIYHYDVEHHCLDVVSRVSVLDELKECVWFEDVQIDQAAVLFVVTAIFQRNTIKYQDRGYRMILMEAGEVGQNMMLMATALNLGSCLLGGFQDDRLSRILQIDGVNEAPLLPIVIGKTKEVSTRL